MNGPAFLLGWVAALAVVCVLADAATDSITGDAIAWGNTVFGALCLPLGARSSRHRPAPGAGPASSSS